MAQQATRDPEYRLSLDLELELERPRLGGRNQPPAETSKAALLRACARKIMPPEFDWEIQPAIGGAAFLILKGVRDIETELHD